MLITMDAPLKLRNCLNGVNFVHIFSFFRAIYSILRKIGCTRCLKSVFFSLFHMEIFTNQCISMEGLRLNDHYLLNECALGPYGTVVYEGFGLIPETDDGTIW